MSASDIIAAFGGIKQLSGITGASTDAVRMWRQIGIPPRYWHVLVDLAGRAGVPGITFETLQATKPVKQEAV